MRHRHARCLEADTPATARRSVFHERPNVPYSDVSGFALQPQPPAARFENSGQHWSKTSQVTPARERVQLRIRCALERTLQTIIAAPKAKSVASASQIVWFVDDGWR